MSHILYQRFYWALVASFVALGLCVAFVQPIYSVPDEFTHWNAAVTRIEHLFGTQGCVTVFDPRSRNRRSHDPMPPYDKQVNSPLSCRKDGDQLYGDVLTYPAAVVSRIIAPRQHESSARQLHGILLTRLIQGLMVLGCLLRVGVLARRSTLSGALVVAALACSPLFAQQAFGISSDGAQLCFGISMFAVVAFWERLRWLDVFLFLLFGWGATAKPFALTCVLPSVITGFWYAQLRAGGDPGVIEILRRLGAALKPTKTPSRQSALLWIGFFLSAATVVLALWGGPKSDSTALDPTGTPKGIDAGAQTAGLQEHPEKILSVGFRQKPEPWLLKSYAGPLGWLDAPMSSATIRSFKRLTWVAIALELLLAGWAIGPRIGVRWRHWRVRLRQIGLPLVVGLTGPIANVFFIALVLYVLWSPVGVSVAKGTQARYYFASLIMLVATLAGAVSVLLRPASREEEASVPTWRPSPRVRTAGRVLRWLAPLFVLVHTVPQISRVFFDLAARYH